MRLATICVAQPGLVRDGTDLVKTAIFKRPVAGPVRVGRTNLEGDGQADLENHGGEHMAVYAYSADHYPRWREELGRGDLEHGGFGENLTVEGLDESQVFLGDQWRIGRASFAVTQPRVPCYKLGIRMGDPGIVKRFSKSLRSGCYLMVLQEGTIEAGDAVEVIARGKGEVRIDRLFEALMLKKGPDGAALLARALGEASLSPAWRSAIRDRLDRAIGP